MEGQIVKINSDLHFISCEDQIYPCKCRGIFRKEHITPVVGDYVLFNKEKRIIEKVLDSSIANAVNNFNMNEENLYVKTCYVDEALVMKRAKMDSRGHVGRSDHKTSHITVIVAEK